MGTDAIFLGLMRAMPFSKRDVRAWVAPNGTFLCGGPMFSALTGIAVEDMVGTNMRSLLIYTEGFDRLLSDSMLLPTEEVTEELFSTGVAVHNRYTGLMPAHCFLTMAAPTRTAWPWRTSTEPMNRTTTCWWWTSRAP